jgi:hypothetical protein
MVNKNNVLKHCLNNQQLNGSLGRSIETESQLHNKLPFHRG